MTGNVRGLAAVVLLSLSQASLDQIQAAQVAMDGYAQQSAHHENDSEDFSGPVCVVACCLVEGPARVEAHVAWQKDTVLWQAGVLASQQAINSSYNVAAAFLNLICETIQYIILYIFFVVFRRYTE